MFIFLALTVSLFRLQIDFIWAKVSLDIIILLMICIDLKNTPQKQAAQL